MISVTPTTPTSTAITLNTIDAAVEHVLNTVQGDIVLGLPLGIGKPNPFVNRLYRRIKAMGNDAEPRRLKIITALSLEKPVGKSDLERHFLEPLVDRVFKDYPDLDYVKDLRGGMLPAHIEVCEFFLKTGDYIGNDLAQRSYISPNYTFVARDMGVMGMNVIAQAVAARDDNGELTLSLSSNPDVTFEVAERYAAEGRPLLKVGVINRAKPFMPHNAVVPPGFFDLVVNDPESTHTLFAPPNGKVSTADYAIGLHAASLVADGGTLQIGIGALGDAIAQALIVRDQQGESFRAIMASICPDGLYGRELGPFSTGLYGCSEMFVNGFLRLINAGIIRREVFDDLALQKLVNTGGVTALQVSTDTLRALVQAGRVGPRLSGDDLSYLQRFGIVQPDVVLTQDANFLMRGAATVPNQLDNPEVLSAIQAAGALGTRLQGGVVMHGGFFLGPTDFYESLRTMPAEKLGRINMTRIDFINQLYGRSQLKRAQRTKARFMNTTMMVTLLGSAVSDGLDSGQVVSGVGGQYNFVAMGHALHDARSILVLLAIHDHKDGPHTSTVWNYANATIPRHLRDVVITEYGVADLRGQTDSEVIKRLIAIADSRFQPELIAAAKQHGKLDADYQLPQRYRENYPQMLDIRLHPWSEAGLLPAFPFGTDLSADELHIVTALKRLKHATQHPVELVSMAVRSLWLDKDAPHEYLERLGLADAHSFKDMFIRKLFAGNL